MKVLPVSSSSMARLVVFLRLVVRCSMAVGVSLRLSALLSSPGYVYL